MSWSMSISGLQVLLAQNDWYRPTTQDSSTHRSRVKHLSFQLHQWCCALQEVLTSNAAFVFFKVHAERAAASHEAHTARLHSDISALRSALARASAT